jgi:8-oxo-dGTP pyrophosphatase MutT (NUDIX family)
MDYISFLRKKIGHDPIILVGGAVLILNDRQELLMILRSDNGAWGVPGGMMEPGETVEETATRETLEETGLRVHTLTLFGVFSGPEFYYVYPSGDAVYNVSVVYLTDDVSGEIELDETEHTRWQYFSLDSLPENVSPPIRPVLKKFAEEYPRGTLGLK